MKLNSYLKDDYAESHPGFTTKTTLCSLATPIFHHSDCNLQPHQLWTSFHNLWLVASLANISSFLAMSSTGDFVLLISYRPFHSQPDESRSRFKKSFKDQHYMLLSIVSSVKRQEKKNGGKEHLFTQLFSVRDLKKKKKIPRARCFPSSLSQWSKKRKVPLQSMQKDDNKW